MKQIIAVIAVSILAAAGGVAYSQEQPATDKFVSKEDYQKLKSAHEKLQQDMDALKAQMQELQKKGPPQRAETEQAIDELEKEIKKVKSLAEAARPGENKFLLAGYGFAGYSDKKGEISSFTAGFNPVFLYKPTDRIFYEAELEVELEGADEVAFDIEYMQLAYVLNDYVTLGAGKFLSPNNYFMERQHIAYINKLPTFPDFIDGDARLQAHTQLGFQARGAVPVGPTTLGYAVYVANGPRIRTAGDSAGTLKFKNFEDNNYNKAVGGRIGFLPIPQLEVGYGFEVAEVGAAGAFDGLQAVSHALDLSYVRASELLKGTVDLRAQLVWLDIDNPNVAPLTFKNNRSGGYVQFAYRPSKLEAPILKNLEGVVRYDWLDLPKEAPNNFDSSNWTLGLNYWLGSHTVLKAAYQFGDRKDPAGVKENTDAFLIQVATGF